MKLAVVFSWMQWISGTKGMRAFASLLPGLPVTLMVCTENWTRSLRTAARPKQTQRFSVCTEGPSRHVMAYPTVKLMTLMELQETHL